MTLQERVAVALHGEFATGSEPCMEEAGRACEVFAEWLESFEAHRMACVALDLIGSKLCLELWSAQRALAAAVRQDEQ